MKHHAADSKLRYSNEGAVAMNEVMIAFLQEIVWRAMNQASNEELTVVNLNHLEKILPQLVIIWVMEKNTTCYRKESVFK